MTVIKHKPAEIDIATGFYLCLGREEVFNIIDFIKKHIKAKELHEVTVSVLGETRHMTFSEFLLRLGFDEAKLFKDDALKVLSTK